MANLKTLAKTIGPGLIFASTAIGTSHLVLSTRAGAHYGMVVFWVIVGALIIKYPFYEYGPRYASATGYSLVKGYRDQGKWAVVLFMIVIGINMFAVVAAVGAVSAGLLSTTFGLSGIPIPVLMGSLLFITALILLIGRYAGLDYFVKLISAVLLVTVTTAFIAVLLKGPIEPINGFIKAPLFKGVGLTLMISLIGWMPNGMEASTMHSIWTIKKSQATGHKPNLKESLFDFNLGYLFTVLLALMFLVIGAFSAYGSGQLFDNGATKFSNQLLVILTENIGQWSYLFVAIAAFGTIYG
ncbi:MAG: divalent metal cation transporter, partial [Bacteroidia bacterium]|nr:divalent metal cation transporter [Bacteroidia bacterium]